MSDIDLSKVDGSPIDDEDMVDVVRALGSCKAEWEEVGLGLRLKPSKISEIKMSHPGDLSGCLRDTVQEWLKKNYNTEKYGDPSWRMIVKAVADFNQGVAKNIATKHPESGSSSRSSGGASGGASKTTSKPSDPQIYSQKPTNRDLTLLKYRDDGGEIKRLKLVDNILNHWEDVGKILGIPQPKLQAWRTQTNNDPKRCCDNVMAHWLQNPPDEYPLTWRGLIDLLEDVGEFGALIDELKKALANKV